MHIALTDAKAQLTDLVRRAEAGDEIILTRHGQPTVQLVPVAQKPDRARRRAVMEEVMAAAAKRSKDGWPDAAHSQDFLYDENGLPA